MQAKNAYRAAQYLWQRQRWYRKQVRRQVGVNSFTGNREGVNTVGGMTLSMFETVFAGTSARVSSQFHRCLTDEDYGDHLMMYISPSKGDAADGSHYSALGDVSAPKKAVALVSHLDSIYPPEVEAVHGHTWQPYSDNSGYIRGPGTMDIKCGTANIAMTLEALSIIDPEVFNSTGFHVWLNAAEEPMAPDFRAVCQRKNDEHSQYFREELLGALVFESGPVEMHPKLRKLLRARAANPVEASGSSSATSDSEEENRSSGAASLKDGMSEDEFMSRLKKLMKEGTQDETESNCTLISGRKGMAVWHVRIRGKPAHAGNEHSRGRSAVLAAADFIQALEAATDYSQDITFNVGSISGGTVHNVVPESAELFVEMRAASRETFNRGVRFARELAQHYNHRDRQHGISRLSSTGISEVSMPGDEENVDSGHTITGPVISLHERAFVPPWIPNEDAKRLFGIWKETGAEFGFDIREQVRGGLSDANILGDWLPTIDGLGPNGGGQHNPIDDPAHDIRAEWVDWPSMIPKAILNAASLSRLIRATE
eukprot:gb/GECG01011664.1/.p1 GENE.gb/GECG01011664.1/~~gb/GECG01011664.1/.p1  ORF type:complete len:541 (+),score=69.77 gb/GECG01011664.1/:1-1623(+)